MTTPSSNTSLDTLNLMISKLRLEMGSAGSPREKQLLRNLLADRKQLLKAKRK